MANPPISISITGSNNDTDLILSSADSIIRENGLENNLQLDGLENSIEQMKMVNQRQDASLNSIILRNSAQDLSNSTKITNLESSLTLDKTELSDLKKLDVELDATELCSLLPNQFDLEKSAAKLEELLTLFIENPTTTRTFTIPNVTWNCSVNLSISTYIPEIKVSVKDMTAQKLVEYILALYGYGIATSNVASYTNVSWSSSSSSWYGVNAVFQSTPELTNNMFGLGNSVASYNNISKRLITFLEAPYANGIKATDLSLNDRYYVDFNHIAQLKLLSSLSKNHCECCSDPLINFRTGDPTGEYFPIEHKCLGCVMSYAVNTGYNFFPSTGVTITNDYKLRAEFVSKEDIKRWPHQMDILNLVHAKRLDDHEKGVNDYFIWSGIYPGSKYGTKGQYQVNGTGFVADPSGTQTFHEKQYTTGDVEGYRLNREISLVDWQDANYAVTNYLAFYEPIEEYVTRTGLSETTYLGINRPADTHKFDSTKLGAATKAITTFKIDNYDNKGVLKAPGYLTVAKYILNDDDLANKIVDKMMFIWNNNTRKLITRVHRAIKGYLNNMSNDDYPGIWRYKIKHILSIERDSNYIATGVKIPHALAPNGLTVPHTYLLSDASQNALNAVYIARDFSSALLSTKTALTAEMVKTQAGIKEMYLYYSKALQLVLNANNNENQEYVYIEKDNKLKGINPDISQNSPYLVAEDIVDNYQPVVKVVKDNLPTIIYDSGAALADFFADIKDFYMDKYVKANYLTFKFDNSANAGIYKIDNSSVMVDQASVTTVLESKLVWKSDFELLGRHYGYNIDGTRKTDEWQQWPTEVDQNITTSIVYTKYEESLKYSWSVNDATGKLVSFDYIHYQHYAMPKLADGSLNYSASAFNSFSDASKNVTDAIEWAKWASQNTTTNDNIQLNYGKRSTYAAFKQDYLNNKLAWYILTNGVAKGIFTHDFIAKNGFFAFTNLYPEPGKSGRLSDYYLDPSNNLTQFCVIDGVDYVAKWSSIKITNRANREQSAGSASSYPILSLPRKLYTISQGYTTLNIKTQRLTTIVIGTVLHEGALGHGFDELPNYAFKLIGIDKEISWIANGTALICLDTKLYSTLQAQPAGRGVIGEGWATYSEIIGIVKNLYIYPDICGNVDPQNESLDAIIYGLNNLSRVASRQVLDAGIHDPKFAYTFNRVCKEQYDITKIARNTPFFREMIRRFIREFTQQTTYAGGLISNLSNASYLKKTIETNYGVGKFSLAKYIQFKVNDGDYLVGTVLSAYCKENLNKFVADGVTLKPFNELIL